MTDFGPIPDGTGWVDAYGRPWVAHGTGLILWDNPVITLLGDDPQKMRQGDPYVEEGATAVDAEGTDITDDIQIDLDGLDTDVPGDYVVTYTVTDQYGGTDLIIRHVVVIDFDTPDVRDILYDQIRAGLPDGVYVYKTPPEQLQAPSVVIGVMAWTPDRMNSLEHLEWAIEVVCVVNRAVPAYTLFTLETLPIKVANILLEGGWRVVGWDGEGSSTIGGPEYLTGTLNIIYKQTGDI